MSVTEIAVRVGIGFGCSLVPGAMMKKDGIRYGMFTTLAALVACNFSGGWLVSAVAAAVLFVYQIYIRFAVKKWRWILATCVSLITYLGAEAILLPGRLGEWNESFKIQVFVATIPLALSMLVCIIELKVRRLKESLAGDVADVKKYVKERVGERLDELTGK